jgi:hypothetical protein
MAAVSVSLMGVGAANADTVFHYTFDPGTYYDFSSGPSDSVSGSFDYDATTSTLSNIDYNRGSDVFTTGVVGSSTELYFGDTTSSDYDVYEFTRSLADGGTDVITGGYHPAIVVDVGGSVSASGAVPEPASWALMLIGLGLVGYAMRGRTSGASMPSSS